MKVSVSLKALIASLILISSANAMEPSLSEEVEQNNNTAPQLQMISQENSVSSTLKSSVLSSSNQNEINVITVSPSNRERDYTPLLESLGIHDNLDQATESCKLLEKLLSENEIAQADMEAISLNVPIKTGLYDWVTNGWGFAEWLVGTSRNFAYLTVVICAVFANVFQKAAVPLATVSGVAAGFGAFLPKTHKYCGERKLKRIAYNMIVMSGQLSKREKIEKVAKQIKKNAANNLAAISSIKKTDAKNSSVSSSSKEIQSLNSEMEKGNIQDKEESSSSSSSHQ
ncbi:MAG: hypothetical protein IJ730_05680 [Alphaproteobacteria bacterium]|nr:hypothetical protein [Alphaproteobacteria bacterium]